MLFAGNVATIDNVDDDLPTRGLGRWLVISPSEALFAQRGFPTTAATPRLERAGGAFVAGHNFAARAASTETILAALAHLPVPDRGFFAEGAAMGAAIRTACLFWRDPLTPLLAALTTQYVHLAHVGVGWAMARLPFGRGRLARRLDPMLAPLAIDGRGFHDGYFRANEIAAGNRALSGEAGRIYDQGVGRSLWFSQGADPEHIAATIARLDAARHSDLWAGVGLASVYAGGAGPIEIDRLILAAGSELRWLRQGAAFAIGAHARAGIIPSEAAETARQLCDKNATWLTECVDQALAQARDRTFPQPGRYQSWRFGVADALGEAA